jgi:peptidoglycan/LPS O-acetylase OafA/YrhL
MQVFGKLYEFFFGSLDSEVRFQGSISKKIQGLDELRGIAVIWVMVCHGGALISWAPRHLGGWGMTGVILFFFVSGYLINLILVNAKEKESFFSKFYIRRIMRIWPLMLLMLIVSAVLYPQTAKYYAFNLSLMNNFNYALGGGVMERTDVMWSLAVEEHFYLIWPLIIFLVPAKLMEFVCLLFVAIGFVFSKGIVPYSWIGMIIHKTSFANLHYIALGCGLVYGRSFFKKSIWLLIALFGIWGITRDFKDWDYSMPVWTFNLSWVSGYILVAQTILSPSKWTIRSEVLARFGKLCYGMYLIHFFVSPFVLDKFGATPVQGLAVYFSLSYFLSVISYRWIEVPIQNMRSLLERKRNMGISFLSICALVFVGYLIYTIPLLGT